MRLRNRLHILLTVAALSLPAMAAAAPARGWEPVRVERSEARTVTTGQDIEIKATRGVIIVTTPRPVNIKVFTILGQLVSNETAPAGTSQLVVGSHGVYIIKVGALTCKVAI